MHNHPTPRRTPDRPGRPERRLTIRLPKAWLDHYTIPTDFFTVQRPERFVIEDDHMVAEAFVLVGWPVFSDRGPVQTYLVGTVIGNRIDGRVEDALSHEHVYIKNLPGRRVVDITPYEGPYTVEVY